MKEISGLMMQQPGNSKLEDANSSIDMPSFQTEHDAAFLWNKAKMGETGRLISRSP